MKCQNSGWTLGGRSVAETGRGALPGSSSLRTQEGSPEEEAACWAGPRCMGNTSWPGSNSLAPPPPLPLLRTIQKDSTAGPGSLRGGGNQNRDSGGWPVSFQGTVLLGRRSWQGPWLAGMHGSAHDLPSGHCLFGPVEEKDLCHAAMALMDPMQQTLLDFSFLRNEALPHPPHPTAHSARDSLRLLADKWSWVGGGGRFLSYEPYLACCLEFKLLVDLRLLCAS